MRCAKCGAENPEGKIICRVCGARLRAPTGGADPAPQATRESDEQLRTWVSYDLLRIVWVMAVVIAVGLGLGFLLK